MIESQLDLKKRHTFRNIFPILLIIPALIPLVAIILVLAIRTVHMSFHRVSYGLPEEYLGGKNFTDMVQ